MESFKASVQYGDWEGTAAADDADFEHAIRNYLENRQLIEADEFLVAASLWVSEGHLSIRAFLLKGHQNFESVKQTLDALDGEPVPVRVVDVPLTLEKFVALFKRFSVMLTWKGLQLEDREFLPTEE